MPDRLQPRPALHPFVLWVHTCPQALLGFVDALHLGRPDLAGWSLGACLALKLAAQHPQRIGRVSWRGLRGWREAMGWPPASRVESSCIEPRLRVRHHLHTGLLLVQV